MNIRRSMVIAATIAFASMGCKQSPKANESSTTTTAESPHAASTETSQPAESKDKAAVSAAAPSSSSPATPPASSPAPAKASASPPKSDASKKKPDTTGTKSKAAKADEAKSSDKKEKDEAIQGKAKQQAAFSAWLQGPAKVKAGSQSAVTAVLVPKEPYKCNAHYPYKFKLDAPPAGISYPQSTVRGANISKHRTTLTIPFQANKPGDARISGTFAFSICTPSNCKMEHVPLSVTVHVE